MTKQINWNNGEGNITLTYTGQGNGSISVRTSPNNLYINRSQLITVSAANKSVQVSITQEKRSYAQDCGYVENGLVFALDGILKGDDTDNWVDLVGGLKFPFEHCVKGENCITFDGSGSMSTTTSKSFPQNSCTIEIVCDKPSTAGFVFQGANNGDVCAYLGTSYFEWGTATAAAYRAKSTDKMFAANADRCVINDRNIVSATTDTWNGGQGKIYIGGWNNSGRLFVGNIYAIRIYNRKLSRAEISSNQAIDNQRFGLNIPIGTNYISDGLIFRLDGIDKGNDSENWTDLINGLKFPYTNCSAGNNHVEFTGVGSTQATSSINMDQNVCTVEVACDKPGTNTTVLYPSARGYIMAAFTESTIKLCYGSNSAPRYNVNFANKLFSANADIGMADTALADVVSNDSWGAQIDGKIKIGGRNTNYFYTGKIYAIRVYNRKLSELEMRQNQRLDNERFELGITL